MSSGTKVIQRALSHIGAHSAIKPARPEAIETGKDMLNSMVASWQDEGIEMGAVPLKAAGDELSEPLGLHNTVVTCLAVRLHPLFPGSQISSMLIAHAERSYQTMAAQLQTVTIPTKKLRGTLPAGQGNADQTFFTRGEEIDSS